MKDSLIENNYKYVPITLLGRGSYGKAYLVECTQDKNKAVIKTIPIDQLSEEAKKEAYLESKILEKLDHPNIIKFREVFLSKPPNVTLHIVMDYANGGDLQKRLKSQKNKYLNENQILDWFTQICLAIKHIHDRKILHRDLKSQNIFLTKNSLIKLGDFGIAKCLSYTLEQVQTVTGTPYYLSPEIVMNKPYSFKSDMWSLGVLLYEMTTLKLPFNAQSLPKLSLNIIKGIYNPLPSHFSKEIRALIASLLQLDPSKRPSIYEVLRCNIIKSRIKVFLSELEYNKEFSHTILHKFNFLNYPELKKIPLKEERKSLNTKRRDSNVNDNLIKNEQPVIHQKPIIFDLKHKEIKKTPNINSKEEKNFYVIEKSTNKMMSRRDKEFHLIHNNLSKNPFNVVEKEKSKDTNLNKINNYKIHLETDDQPQKQISQPSFNKLHIDLNHNSNIQIKQKPQSLNSNNEYFPDRRLSNEIKNEPFKLVKEGIHDDIINVLAKHKKKLHIKDIKNTPFDSVENKEIIQSPKLGHSTLQEFIETMHKKINSSVIQNEGAQSEPIQIESNKNEIKDLISTHKMLVELSNLDEFNQDLVKNHSNNSKESSNNELPNINLEKLNLSNEYKYDHFIPDTITSKEINLEIDNKNNYLELESENSELEVMRKELEDELGSELLIKTYKVIVENTPENELKIDFDLISGLLNKELVKFFDDKEILKVMGKIYEVWSLVVKERQENLINRIR